MNPAFYILVVLAAIALWFLLAEAFPAIGSWLKNRVNDVKFYVDDDTNYEEIEKENYNNDNW